MTKGGKQRGYPEDGHACQKNAPAPGIITKPASQQQTAAKTHQVDGLDPLGGSQGNMQIRRHQRQCQVDNGDVKGFEKDG